MSDITLTSDEKRSLRMWFRQAIVEVERREATRSLLQFYGADNKPRDGHHAAVARRTRRTPNVHPKELV